MASPKKIAANRANAQASSGPKTAEGKARVAKNALRHGLSKLIATDPALSKEAEILAQAIAGTTDNPRILQAARTAADAQIDVARVRQARHQLLSLQIEQSRLEETSSEGRSPEDLLTAALRESATSLTRMDRYERRALSRRKFAIRKLERTLKRRIT